MRAFDIVVSLLGLILLSPALIVIAVLVRVTSPGPALYRARRVGRDGKKFDLLKYRTMVVGADRAGPGITASDDRRVTPQGRFLRKSKLDELPQLINVLRGEMALVGPRPEDPRYVALYSAEQRRVLSVRPGITGAASLVYRDESSMIPVENAEDCYITQIMPAKLAIEREYLEHRTLWTDLALIVRTLWRVISS